MNPQHDPRHLQGQYGSGPEGGYRGEGQGGAVAPEDSQGGAHAGAAPQVTGQGFGGWGHVPRPPYLGDPQAGHHGGFQDEHGAPWGRPAGASSPGLSGWGQVPHAPQGELHEEFDPEYRRWREEQLRALDEDYRAWRQDRYRQFADEFSRWRSRHAAESGGRGNPGH